MSYYRNDEFVETSHQGALRMIQLDLQGHLLGTDEKIERLQKKIELLVIGMNQKTSRQSEVENLYEEELDDYKENVTLHFTQRGMFRDPTQASTERQKAFHRQYKVDDDARAGGFLEEL
ncbi:hypothetical protein AgCh_022886 [Apium graveolens]